VALRISAIEQSFVSLLLRVIKYGYTEVDA
jgi:hypothetical protein